MQHTNEYNVPQYIRVASPYRCTCSNRALGGETRRRISRKHWRQLNKDSWIKEMFDVSVDMSSVRRTFIPDIFLHQCCQHSFHNFSAMRPKSTPHHQHTNPTPATRTHKHTQTHTHTTHTTHNNHTQTTNTTNTRTRQTQQRQQTHTHRHTVNDHLAKVESSKSLNIQASNTWHQQNVMPSTITLELMFECIQRTLHPWKFQTSKFSSHTQGLMAGHARPGIFCRAIGSCPTGAVSARILNPARPEISNIESSETFADQKSTPPFCHEPNHNTKEASRPERIIHEPHSLNNMEYTHFAKEKLQDIDIWLRLQLI